MSEKNDEMQKEFDDVYFVAMSRAQVDCKDPEDEQRNIDSAMKVVDRKLKAEEQENDYRIKMRELDQKARELDIREQEVKQKEEDAKRMRIIGIASTVLTTGLTIGASLWSRKKEFERNMAILDACCNFETTGVFTSTAFRTWSKNLLKDVKDIKM